MQKRICACSQPAVQRTSALFLHQFPPLSGLRRVKKAGWTFETSIFVRAVKLEFSLGAHFRFVQPVVHTVHTYVHVHVEKQLVRRTHSHQQIQEHRTVAKSKHDFVCSHELERPRSHASAVARILAHFLVHTQETLPEFS